MPNFKSNNTLPASPQGQTLATTAQVRPTESIPSYVELNVPYISQLDNKYNPSGSSNVTAIATVLAYYGIQPRSGQGLPDELYEWFITQNLSRHDPQNLAKAVKHYGLRDTFKVRATWTDVLQALRNGQPVIVHGYFTASGHIVTLVGYTPTHVIINDSWGNATTGYSSRDGKKVLYPIDYVLKVLSPEGPDYIWAHFIAP